MSRIAIFLAVSAAIVLLSRRSLAHPRSHGFYRFFAFELLAALVLTNAPVWFSKPLSLRQLVSWSFGTASIVLAMEGFRLLRAIRQALIDRGQYYGSGLRKDNQVGDRWRVPVHSAPAVQLPACLALVRFF